MIIIAFIIKVEIIMKTLMIMRPTTWNLVIHQGEDLYVHWVWNGSTLGGSLLSNYWISRPDWRYDEYKGLLTLNEIILLVESRFGM